MLQLKIIENKLLLNVTEPVVKLKIKQQYVKLRVIDGAVVYVNNGGNTVNITASENLGGHRVVTVEGYYASNQVSTDKFKVLGVTTGAASIGGTATIATFGTITESSWNWTVGNPVFLSTNGQLTQTPPTTGFRTIIGKPETATKLFINISEPITLI